MGKGSIEAKYGLIGLKGLKAKMPNAIING